MRYSSVTATAIFGLGFDIFVVMKKILLLFFLFPLMLSAQLDFESYRGKLNFVELPIVTTEFQLPLVLKKSASPGNPFSVFRLNRQNFREPVNMMEAMIASEESPKSKLQLNIDPREYGVSAGSSSYSTDGATKVNNSAYREASRGFFVADACPPFGICPRCAPYRIRNGY